MAFPSQDHGILCMGWFSATAQQNLLNCLVLYAVNANVTGQMDATDTSEKSICLFKICMQTELHITEPESGCGNRDGIYQLKILVELSD